MGIARGHQIETISGESNDLRLDAGAVIGNDIAAVADRSLTADRFQREADHAIEGAFNRRQGHLLRALAASRQTFAPIGGTLKKVIVGDTQSVALRVKGACYQSVNATLEARVDLGGVGAHDAASA